MWPRGGGGRSIHSAYSLTHSLTHSLRSGRTDSQECLPSARTAGRRRAGAAARRSRRGGCCCNLCIHVYVVATLVSKTRRRRTGASDTCTHTRMHTLARTRSLAHARTRTLARSHRLGVRLRSVPRHRPHERAVVHTHAIALHTALARHWRWAGAQALRCRGYCGYCRVWYPRTHPRAARAAGGSPG